MAHAIWKGTISFGLVNIPVSLVSAEKREALDFKLLDRRDNSPVGYQRINKTTNQPVEWDDIVKGYEVEGEMVVLTEEDFDRVSVEATQTVEISSFVDLHAIDFVYFDRPYYLVPQKTGKQKLNKAYVLLRETLERTKKVGIAKVVIRTREHLALVMPREHLLVLNLLRFPDEVRAPKDFVRDDADVKVGKEELAMAERLVQEMTGDWRPSEYRDEYRSQVLAMIERKAKSGKTAPIVEATKERKASKVVDLIPLLKRSVAARRKTEETSSRREAARRPTRRSKGRRAASRKRARKSA